MVEQPRPEEQPESAPDAVAPTESEQPTSAAAPDETGMDATAVAPPVEPRWSARAGVPASGGLRPAAPTEWRDDTSYSDPYAGRSWFTPIVVAMVAMLLLAVLGTGIWLIVNAGDQGAVQAPAPSASVKSSAPARTTAPNTAGPTTASPSNATVRIPELAGTTQADAEQLLLGLGLKVKAVPRLSSVVPPGIVVDTDPPSGTEVAKDTEVTLFVASLPPTSPAAASPTASASPTDET